jgi:hypothetical protein
MARKPLPDVQPTIDRLKAIAAAAGDHLLLADGPANPDIKLLDLCAEALHHLTAAETAYQSRPWRKRKPGEEWTPELAAHDQELMATCYRHRGQACSCLTQAKKLRAHTAAGIYAKALCVRASVTGAAQFAMSLAEDLVNNPTLRAALWAADARPTGSV